MDISPTALVNALTQMQQSLVAQTAQVLVLKKAMYIQATGALALLQALPLATRGNLGTQVNTMA
ncbi:MAG: putative motility protein [Rhodoferax sp.]